MELSVIVPVYNEASNVQPLLAEIHQALKDVGAFEVIYVDDGSDDGTRSELSAALQQYPDLRVLHHQRRCGQSNALLSGIRAARAPWIVTLDGDGQNDPADIPRLLQRFRAQADTPRLMLAGQRLQRRDNWLRRLSSRIANGVRGRLLHDATPDTGCGLKLFSRDVFLSLPVFDHMHRFLPALMLREEVDVVSVPVTHRPRRRGVSKYGVSDRLWVGLVDLLGVMWLQRRPCRAVAEEES